MSTNFSGLVDCLWVEMIKFCGRSRDVVMVTNFWCESAKFGISQSDLHSLHFTGNKNGLEDRSADVNRLIDDLCRIEIL